MSTNSTKEEKINQFEQAVKSVYTEFPNQKKMDELHRLYSSMNFFGNTVILLIDHLNFKCTYISENVQEVLGVSAKEVMSSRSNLFPYIDWAHLGFAYRYLQVEKKITPHLNKQSIFRKEIFIGGINIRHQDGRRLRGFYKGKHLIANKDNLPELSIVMGKDYSHFFKGKGYWIRMKTPEYGYCYFSRGKKKEFTDLVSPSELEVLKLIAEQKSSKEISELLHISKDTVDSHRKNMINRTGLINTTALVHICKEMDIL